MQKIAADADEKFRQMIGEPVEPLLRRLAVPSVISMLVTTFYNMADSFFVSQINTSASGAVGVIFSMMTIMQALAFTIGIGSGNIVSRCLGMRKREQAERYVAICFFTELILGITLAGIGLLLGDRLVYMLGATPTIAPYAKAYARYILLGAPFIMASFGMNNLLRFQGNSFYGMIGIATGGILNIFLDPLFIFVFKLGIAGAAQATALSQMISFTILTLMCNTRKACIPVRLKNFRPKPGDYRRIVYIGMPSFARQGVVSIANIVLNFAAHPYGDAVIAAFSVVGRITHFLNSAVIGIGQGFQPVCGYNYGAKRFDRVLKAYDYSLKLMVITLLCLGIPMFFFAKPVMTAFRRDDPMVIREGTRILRLQLAVLPLLSQITLSNMFSQNIGYGFRASFIAMLRQGIYLVPCLLILPRFFGLLGLEFAQPVSDILSAVTAFLMTRAILGELREKAKAEETRLAAEASGQAETAGKPAAEETAG